MNDMGAGWDATLAASSVLAAAVFLVRALHSPTRRCTAASHLAMALAMTAMAIAPEAAAGDWGLLATSGLAALSCVLAVVGTRRGEIRATETRHSLVTCAAVTVIAAAMTPTLQ